MIIRQALLSDLSALRKLSIDAFIKAYASFNTEPDMQKYLQKHFSEAVLEKELTDHSLHYLVAIEGSELIGYAKLDCATELNVEAQRPLEIARLYTHPGRIGSGIGVKLLESVHAWARDRAYDALCLCLAEEFPCRQFLPA
jgi:diamine N-acetyltransferase